MDSWDYNNITMAGYNSFTGKPVFIFTPKTLNQINQSFSPFIKLFF